MKRTLEKYWPLLKHIFFIIIYNFLLHGIFYHICNLPYVDVEYCHLLYKAIFYLANLLMFTLIVADIIRLIWNHLNGID